MSSVIHDIALPSTQPPPWLADDSFPAKPPDADYGYNTLRGSKPCTLEQLRAKLAAGGISAPSLVWTPQTPRLVTPIEVPSLVDRVRLGRRSDATQGIQSSVINLIGWPLLAAIHGSWCLLLAMALGLLPLIQGLYARRQAKRLTPELAIQQIPNARFEAWVSLQRALATNTVIAGVVLIGVAQLFIGLSPTVNAAGLVKPLVHAGQFWRLMTATMLHGGILHILFNVGALAALGYQVERLTNRPLFIIVYTLSAIGGSISSCLLLPMPPPSAHPVPSWASSAH
jgi:membrane associated rhomboid family serine protease